LTTDITGTLGAANGGTGATSLSSAFSVVSNILKSNEHHSFTYSTSTAWTGTTTQQIEIGYGEVWNTIQCFTDTGTLNVQVGYGSDVNNNTQRLDDYWHVQLHLEQHHDSGQKSDDRSWHASFKPDKDNLHRSRPVLT